MRDVVIKQRAGAQAPADAELRQRITQLEAIQRINQELSTTLDLQHLLDKVLEEAVLALGARRGCVLLKDPAGTAYQVPSCAGWEEEALPALTQEVLHHPLVEEAIRAGRPQAGESANSVTALAIPIFYTGQVIGVLFLERAVPSLFAEGEVEFAGMLATQASIAIGNAWRYEELVRQREALRRRAEQLSHLFHIAQDARSDRPLEELLEDAAYAVQESVGFNIVMFSVVAGDPPMLERVAAAGLPIKVFEELKAVRQPLAKVLALLKDEYRIGNQSYFFPHQRFREWGAELHVYTSPRAGIPTAEGEWHPDDMLLVPLWGKSQQVLGILSVDDPRDRRLPGPATIEALETFAGQAAIAIENRRLFELERRRAEVAETVLQVGQALSSSLEPRRILQTVVDEVARLFHVERSAVLLFDAEREFGRIAAEHYPPAQEPAPVFRVSLSTDAVLSRVMEQRGVIFIEDMAAERGMQELGSFWKVRQPRSLLVVPLIVRDEVTGVIMLESLAECRRFSQEEIQQCQLIANMAATAIENARLYDEVWAFSRQLELRVEERTRELRRERDRVQALYRIARELSSSLDQRRVMHQALKLLQEAVGATEGLIMLVDERSPYLVIRAAIGRPAPLPREGQVTQLRRDQGLAGWVITQRKPTIVPDTTRDERWVTLEGTPNPPRSALAVPLLAGEDVLGALFLFHDQLDYFNEGHLTLVTAAASQVASAINNATLYRLITEQAERLGAMWRQQREEASRNEAILRSIADGVLVNDVHGRVILMNTAAERILEARASSALGQDVRNFFAAAEPEGRQRVIQAVNAMLEAGGPPQVVQTQLEIGGRIISTNIAPVLTEHGELLGLVTVLRDITREVEADRAKSEFVSTVSHELRTPMTSIKGYTDLLVMGAVGELNETQQRFLKIIQQNADRLTSLINDLLDISRIETGRIELNMTPVDLGELIRSVAVSMAGQAAQNGLTLQVQVEENLPLTMADKDRLMQVLVNLVGNAILYTDQGGRVDICARPVESAIVVEVADTGIGIPKEDLGKIFDRFYRGESERVQQCQGTGLGLAIVKSFVEMHGGRIWVESEPGKGSVFTFTLPIRPAE
ncbi:MAG: GAF domain-containing protein [Anaerolineae bacterium]